MKVCINLYLHVYTYVKFKDGGCPIRCVAGPTKRVGCQLLDELATLSGDTVR